MQSNDIKEILRQIRAREAGGFELLYQHYFRFMFSVAYSVPDSEEDSYDVIQSVMLRLYRLDEKLFPSEHELSWLRTVVRNEALMYLRREKPSVPLEEAEHLPAPEQKIEDFVDMDAFRSMTDSLNERQKKVVSMKILSGLRPVFKVLRPHPGRAPDRAREIIRQTSGRPPAVRTFLPPPLPEVPLRVRAHGKAEPAQIRLYACGALHAEDLRLPAPLLIQYFLSFYAGPPQLPVQRAARTALHAHGAAAASALIDRPVRWQRSVGQQA